MSEHAEADQRMIEALRRTADPPRPWIDAAVLIPDTLGDLASIERVMASAQFRDRFAKSPDAAIAELGLPGTRALVAAMRAQLT